VITGKRGTTAGGSVWGGIMTGTRKVPDEKDEIPLAFISLPDHVSPLNVRAKI